MTEETTTEQPERPKLNETDRKIVTFILTHHEEHGWPPTMTQIGEHVGLSSKSGVFDRLAKLEQAGVIKRITNGKRTLRIDVLEIP